MKKKEEIMEDENIDTTKEIVTIKKEGFSYPEMVIIMIIAILFGFLIGNVVSFTKKETTNSSVPSELKEFVDTYNDIVNNYYDKVNKEELIDAGIKGMINYLDDPYATYFDGTSSTNFNQTLEGNYEGVGIEVTLDNSKVKITKVFADTPAKKAGIKVGDYITKVNGESVEGKSLSDVVSLIKTAKNKEVEITITRDNQEKTMKVTRTTVDMPYTSSKVYEENGKKIGYLKIEMFSNNITKQVKKELESLKKKNIDKLVIDVRDNPGGYLTQVTEILSLFMTKKDVIYQLQTKNNNEKVYGTSSKATYSYPVVVLINENSASASEILASAFKETYNAEIVGVNSYGKGTVQKTGDLNNGDTIKYTVQKWLTPKGNWINEKGVTPTKEVKLELKENETLTEDNDNQLKAAIELASK
ncbi:carboxyl-terminal processing protease [Clostridium sp. CAG:451]|nr:carboxyl-terminal processing protease [Clostridium sp. CAG:451]